MKLNLNIIASLFVLAAVLCACNKKDKLEGDKALFIGEWKWEQSIHYHGWCDDANTSDTLTPITESNDYFMVIEEKGIVQFRENNVILEEMMMGFNIFGDIPCDDLKNGITFSIHLDNDGDNTFEGSVNNDSIIVSTGFPYSSYHEGCERYISIFTKL